MRTKTFQALAVLLMSLSVAACQGKTEKAPPAVTGKVEKGADNAAKAPAAAAAPATGDRIEVAVEALLDGKPAEKAKVTVSGTEEGETDAEGRFAKVLVKRAGEEVEVAVGMEAPGLVVTPWKGTFVVRLPKDNVVERYAFKADLAATRFVTLVVKEKDSPVEGATVRVRGKEAGKTDKEGKFVYRYKDVPKKGFVFEVAREGYAPWSRTERKPSPGQTFEVSLAKRTTVAVAVLTEEHGRTRGIAGAAVTVDGKAAGKTGAQGTLKSVYTGKPGKKIVVALSVPGHLPERWETAVKAEGDLSVQRYFYPAVPVPVRLGVYGFVSNTPGADLTEAVGQAEAAVKASLFRSPAFREVPAAELARAMKRAKLSVGKATTKGWKGTALAGLADILAFGSVARDEGGFLVETKFFGPDGKPVLSLIARAAGSGDIPAAAREIAADAVERFPFKGAVVAAEEDRYRINLGKATHRVARGSEFDLFTPVTDKAGKVIGLKEAGILKVTKVDEAGAWAAVEDLKGGAKVAVGDRVVRYVPRAKEGEGDAVLLSVKGGVTAEGPLAGVNVYLNGEWAGTTGPEGTLAAPVRLGKTYALLLYRQGYGPVSEKLRAGAAGERKEYRLRALQALFRVDSVPPGAEVFVDGASVGRTPIAAGVPVPLGFHTVRVAAGGDYRDFEEILEFGRDVEDRKIVLFKDYLAAAERARKAGQVDGAIRTLDSVPKDHPDFSEARTRLGQLYLDEKEDYNGAIREFENVLSLPRNRQLIYKQYAVVFANLGHAYYEKGSALVHRDRDTAAACFTKAIQNLQTARQNVRFFPAERHDEAVHDTYYYTALSYHKLYLMTKKGALLESADNAWREYFDFFPASLEGKGVYMQSREAARRYRDQLKERI